MASFDIVLKTQGTLHPNGEPSDFVSEYTGIISCTNDDTGEVTKVGKVAALRVHAGLAQNAGESLFDVCDSHSGELHFLHTMLYENDGHHFRENLMARFDAYEPDLLVLDYVVLSPKWRKLKLGLLAVRKMVDMIGGGCGLAVSLIAPSGGMRRSYSGYRGAGSHGIWARKRGGPQQSGCEVITGGWVFHAWGERPTMLCQ